MFYNVLAYSDILEPLIDMHMTACIWYSLCHDVIVSLDCCLEPRIQETVQSDCLICFFQERTANNICSRVAKDIRVIQTESD